MEMHTQRAQDNSVVFDPVAYVHALWRHKVSLIAAPLLLGATFYALSYAAHKTWRSEVLMMPPKPASGGGLIVIGGKGGGDEYRMELASRTVAQDVVRHLDLVHRLKAPDEDTAVAMTRGMAQFKTDASNFITITVTSGDKNLSADVANGYFAALERFTGNLARREAEHRLNYMAGPLKVEQERLRASEDELAKAQSSTGLVLPGTQGPLGVQQVSALRSRVSELEGELATLRAGATDENPRVIALRSQIANLQGQIHSLETSSAQANSPGNLPKLSLEVLRKQREVELHTQTLEALARSMGTMQTMESYTPALSVIDPAIPAKSKYSPRRMLWALCGFMLGLIGALVNALGGTAYGEWSRTAAGETARQRWKASWRSRSAPGVVRGA